MHYVDDVNPFDQCILMKGFITAISHDMDVFSVYLLISENISDKVHFFKLNT